MTEFALGLAALGRPAYLTLGRDGALPTERTVARMRAATFAVLDAAYDGGIRWVDAARSYGRAEEFLAGWLRSRRARDVTVSSKWGYAYVGDWRRDAEVHEVKEHTLARFRAQHAETVELLRARLHLYQVHSLTPDSPLLTDEPLLDALAALADTGVRVGFTTSGPRQADTVRAALALERGGRPVFTAVQATWNLLEPSAGPALAEAHAAGVRVLVKEVLANGRLAVDPPEPVREAAETAGVGPDALALAVARDQPWTDVVLLGAAGPRQLTANLRAAEVTGATTDPAAFAALAEPAEQYWATRAALPWT